MKNLLTKNLFCSTFGHNYFRLNHTNSNSPELICKTCGKYFTYEANDRIIETPSNHSKIDPILQYSKL